MSYDKAMRHNRNIKKCRKQGGMYMGFDAGTGAFKETPEQRHLAVCRMEVRRWFAERHSNGDSQYMRECIRDAITNLRQAMRALTASHQPR